MKLKLEKPGLVELDPAFIHPNFEAKAVRRLVRNYENSMKSEMDAALDSARSNDARVNNPRHTLFVAFFTD